MSLPTKAIDRLFERLAATYGAQWTRQWADVPMADVKAAWAHELSTFAQSLHRIAWALENLPPKCPNVIEFKHLCRQAPSPEAPRLPEPKADPERVKRELAKLGDVRTQTVQTATTDHKAWAKRILARHEAGEKINPTSLRFAREALRSHLMPEAA
ncbi:hypothetical protein [Hydrogenophaga aquatica]